MPNLVSDLTTDLFADVNFLSYLISCQGCNPAHLVIRRLLDQLPWSPCRSVLGLITETQTALDVLVGTLHGSHRHQCMNVCMNYCKSLWTKAFGLNSLKCKCMQRSTCVPWDTKCYITVSKWLALTKGYSVSVSEFLSANTCWKRRPDRKRKNAFSFRLAKSAWDHASGVAKKGFGNVPSGKSRSRTCALLLLLL